MVSSFSESAEYSVTPARCAAEMSRGCFKVFPYEMSSGAAPAARALSNSAREAMSTLNGGLQIGYFILAARSLGLDCGPMGGFANAKVDELFLAGTGWKSNFLLNLGYGDRSTLHPRNPRLGLEQAARFL